MASSIRYHLGGYIAAAPQQNLAEVYDGTAGTYTAWDTSGVQTSTRPLTVDEVASLAAQDTAATAAANGATLRQKAQSALNANATFLAIASPTNAQVLAQTQLLTKECNAIIRLLIGQLDSVSGT